VTRVFVKIGKLTVTGASGVRPDAFASAFRAELIRQLARPEDISKLASLEARPGLRVAPLAARTPGNAGRLAADSARAICQAMLS
jgi:hypothetical protein